MLVPRTEHVGVRPHWDCRVCGGPWPCATAKVELAEQYQNFPHGLSVFLGSWLALLSVSGLAVLFGRVLLRYLRLSVVHYIAGSICLILAAVGIYQLATL